jgi:hypothetical protein
VCKSALFVGVASLFSVTGDGVNKIKKTHMEKDVIAYCASKFNKGQFFFFAVVPCILILSKSYIYQLMHNRVALKEY